MNTAAILNGCIALLVFTSLIYDIVKAENQKKRREIFRFFTVDSNILCGLASLILAVCALISGPAGVPDAVYLIKYVSMAAVAVTFTTVIVFLGPTQGGLLQFYKGTGLWFHLVVPVLAMLSWLFTDGAPVPDAWGTAAGVLPVLVYALIYLNRVVYAPEEKRWPDFYGFMRNGDWKISFVGMLAGSGILAVIFTCIKMWISQ